jgi:hypothetical protein
MAFPIAPVAGLALRYGSVMLATYAATRMLQPGQPDPRAETAMDDLPPGLRLRRFRDQVNAGARWSRSFRPFPDGPGVKLDVAGLARLRLTRI